METTNYRAANVEVIDEAFYMPQLDRYRRVWVYKPLGYYRSMKRYPVIYMHDGQNLFDDTTAFAGEWGIDETLNEMLAECIIVGVDNSEHRMTEYNFRSNKQFGAGEGKKYLRFIIKTLKPVIDLNFRTLKDRLHTHLAGSSMGGLISLYGAMHYPRIFGGAGVFSPSLWLVPGVANELNRIAGANKKFPQRFYLYGGAKEGEFMVESLHGLNSMFKQHPRYAVQLDIDPEGEHNEYYWRNKFRDYYNWLSL